MDINTITQEDAVRIVLDQYALDHCETEERRQASATRRVADFFEDVKKPTEARLHRWIKQNTRWEKKDVVAVQPKRRDQPMTQMTRILRNRRRS